MKPMTSDAKSSRMNEMATLSSTSPNSLTTNTNVKESVAAEKSNQSVK
jgi:hypothetical protein